MAGRYPLLLCFLFMGAAVCSGDRSVRAACHLGTLGLCLLQGLGLALLEKETGQIFRATLPLLAAYLPALLLLLWQGEV